MKANPLNLLILIGAALAVCGCNRSQSPSSSGNGATSAASPAKSASAPAAEMRAAKATVSEAAAQFTAKAQSAADKQLGAIGAELANQAKSFGKSLGTNNTIQSKLDNTLQSLTAGQDSDALSTVYQVMDAAKLTPQQTELAKEVGNLTSAYVVQKNFASLEGAQGDVATIVNSLQKGEVANAMPAIHKVAQNANLTPSQKELIGSLADRYAPGLKQAGEQVQQGLQHIQNLPGLKK